MSLYTEHRRENLNRQHAEYMAFNAREIEDERHSVMATPSDAHREWHWNSGVPMGQPGCPQDACHPVEEDFEVPEVKCGNKQAHEAWDRNTGLGYHYTSREVEECFARTGRFADKGEWHSTGPEAKDGHWQNQCPGETCPTNALPPLRPDNRARYAAWRTIPVYGHNRAYYALDITRNGVTTTEFFRVTRPAKGKNAGRTYVDRQASERFDRLPSFEASGWVLDRIAANPDEAALRYGQIGKCSRCNRTLTDTESRARGMGPECVKKGN